METMVTGALGKPRSGSITSREDVRLLATGQSELDAGSERCAIGLRPPPQQPRRLDTSAQRRGTPHSRLEESNRIAAGIGQR